MVEKASSILWDCHCPLTMLQTTNTNDHLSPLLDMGHNFLEICALQGAKFFINLRQSWLLQPYHLTFKKDYWVKKSISCFYRATLHINHFLWLFLIIFLPALISKINCTFFEQGAGSRYFLCCFFSFFCGESPPR